MAFTPLTYVLSKRLDPLLGIATGVLAFYLNEHNPRTAPPPGQTFMDVTSWRINQLKLEFSQSYAERQRRNLERDLQREREADEASRK
ncbi:hypothetical protein EXIGLDRAFT_759319 [Exidia glandulosa HHB12029]|uniref:Uncharacterized protein n=1 Tax=Exidia glandulosa HHB12029 TaxID=1314781 RepID=A0A165Q2V4_EXIGL|nr:hypothetical protein EXIGLDRAFT_759319 [Exidia glandulosa HHB12029]